MTPLIAIAAALLAMTAPGEPPPSGAPVESRLDGLSIEGRVRARGLIGVFSVPGTLSFQDGDLIWSVRGEDDRGAYRAWPVEDGIRFEARHVIENDETALWTGLYDGERVRDVSIVWTRVEGDFLHDLLLPGEVTLEFRPSD